MNVLFCCLGSRGVGRQAHIRSQSSDGEEGERQWRAAEGSRKQKRKISNSYSVLSTNFVPRPGLNAEPIVYLILAKTFHEVSSVLILEIRKLNLTEPKKEVQVHKAMTKQCLRPGSLDFSLISLKPRKPSCRERDASQLSKSASH